MKPEIVIFHQGFWTRQYVKDDSDYLYVFGDNTYDRIHGHVPYKTQAVIRGLSNALGIDTKRNRFTYPDSYFTNADFDMFVAHVDKQFEVIRQWDRVCLPADGIGTGKAQLKQRAPKLFYYLQNRLQELV